MIIAYYCAQWFLFNLKYEAITNIIKLGAIEVSIGLPSSGKYPAVILKGRDSKHFLRH